MKLGKIKILFFILLFFHINLNADDKISTVPLVNLEDLKPSYEEVQNDSLENENSGTYKIKEKDRKKSKSKNASINILGLDKITAKTTEMKLTISSCFSTGILSETMTD